MKYIEDIPSIITEKLAELVEVIEVDHQEEINSYKENADKWLKMYYRAISEPCRHKRTRVEKSDKVRFICECCGFVTDEYDDFAAAAKGLTSGKVITND